MKTKILNTALLLFLGMYITNCSQDQNPVKTDLPCHPNGKITKITLQNQNDHFGILVKLVELDTLTITDSSGVFSFENLPDGEYTLKAGYPYFAPVQNTVRIKCGTIQTPVNIELQQQLQFWIEPPETTFSLSVSSMFNIQLFATNITDTVIKVWGYLGPDFFTAFEPQGFSWPYIPNSDSIMNFCEFRFGIFRNNELTYVPQFTFMPGDTVSSPIFVPIEDACFLVGNYRFFSAVTDLGRYREYFDIRYFLNEDDPLHVIYLQMNRSVFRKDKLFRPALVHVVE